MLLSQVFFFFVGLRGQPISQPYDTRHDQCYRYLRMRCDVHAVAYTPNTTSRQIPVLAVVRYGVVCHLKPLALPLIGPAPPRGHFCGGVRLQDPFFKARPLFTWTIKMFLIWHPYPRGEGLFRSSQREKYSERDHAGRNLIDEARQVSEVRDLWCPKSRSAQSQKGSCRRLRLITGLGSGAVSGFLPFLVPSLITPIWSISTAFSSCWSYRPRVLAPPRRNDSVCQGDSEGGLQGWLRKGRIEWWKSGR